MKPTETFDFNLLYEEASLDNSGDADIDLEITPLYHSLSAISVRYTEEKTIGIGGMKEVVRAYDARTEREVALARPKQGTPRERYDAFLREAHITSRLEHPNIIKLFDMGIDGQGRPFFTMELKRGSSLRKIISDIRKGKSADKFTYAKRLALVLRICEAMEYAHSRYVLHLDLKPENIQIGTFGEVQVCDWSMGEIERRQTEQHTAESLLDPDLYGDQLEHSIGGTPGYMAPEQNQHRSVKTAQTDIYALGCILYELCTLKPPTSRAKHPPDSPAIAAIVEKACAEDPADRYISAAALHADIYRHLRGFSTDVEKAGLGREIALFYRRNKLACVLGFLVLLSAFGTAMWFIPRLQASNNRAEAALIRTEKALALAEKSGAEAREQQTIAVEARNRAEEALERYRSESNFVGALLSQRGKSTIEESWFLTHTMVIDEEVTLAVIDNIIKELETGISENLPDHEKLSTLKAHILFLSQKFSEASDCYPPLSQRDKDLRKHIPEFEKLTRKDGLLPTSDFGRLMKLLSTSEVKSREPLIEKMFVYDALKRKSPTESAEILEMLLRLNNDGWVQGIFRYDADNRSMRLSGGMLRSFYRKGGRRDEELIPVKSLLRLIPIDSLDLRGSGISDLWHLEGTRLTKLDIRSTPTKDLSPLVAMATLRELIVSPGQFTEKQLAVLPRNVTVNISDAP
ncbi:MAG: serine/threonine protein kinase [Akkermansiaceae bacterium]|jgi:serine/threonine protein kinase|nr:serine/threonine protein kinase [Akkermansiaceae bacterium]MDP4721024.1 serine/threonine protein kinase [Akkermansiaceae bacterium]MDP4848358.1 serine/threonine protein kinase [Akkermansiaceae bacterium]MDP4897664.1 serine/threonine protein kinase [Akkermansiaceae bacterium]